MNRMLIVTLTSASKLSDSVERSKRCIDSSNFRLVTLKFCSCVSLSSRLMCIDTPLTHSYLICELSRRQITTNLNNRSSLPLDNAFINSLWRSRKMYAKRTRSALNADSRAIFRSASLASSCVSVFSVIRMTQRRFRGRFHSVGQISSNRFWDESRGKAKYWLLVTTLFSVGVGMSYIATLATGREESSLNSSTVSRLGCTL